MGQTSELFDFHGKTIVMTGATGVLGTEMAFALAERGAHVAALHSNPQSGDDIRERFRDRSGQLSLFVADVTNPDVLREAAGEIVKQHGKVDGLINAAGGNKPQATTNPEQSFFDLPADALRAVFDLNLLGTILPCQIFGRLMAQQKHGAILNISSMAAMRPLTRIPAYASAKAAVNSFTQWLAVHMAQEYSPNIRVNAVAPGFFLTRQNKFLLTDRETGEWTPRGKSIVSHTPMGRLGAPEDLVGTVLWLMSPASAFVTGIVVPVDGGFSAFSGV